MYLGKRIFDMILAVPAVILLAPVYLMVAALVKLSMGSPVLFRQDRPGLHGKIFTLLKFRTMTDKTDEEGELLHDLKRITPVGIWLRRTSMDELPQLLNVIKGDMSIVGPRPLLVEYLDFYTPEQSRRHDVRPGITGWAQIHGRNDTGWEERFANDVWYVVHSSFLLDCKIILATIRSVLSSDTSVEQEHRLGRFTGSLSQTKRDNDQIS